MVPYFSFVLFLCTTHKLFAIKSLTPTQKMASELEKLESSSYIFEMHLKVTLALVTSSYRKDLFPCSLLGQRRKAKRQVAVAYELKWIMASMNLSRTSLMLDQNYPVLKLFTLSLWSWAILQQHILFGKVLMLEVWYKIFTDKPGSATCY